MLRVAVAICLVAFLWSSSQGSPLKNGDHSPRARNDKRGPAMYRSGFFEGDIELSKRPRTAVAKWKWDGGKIPYTLDSSIDQPALDSINKAIEQFNLRTCVRWVKRSGQTDYVRFIRPSSGCWSKIGQDGGRQDINLGKNCEGLGTVTHEMMHAMAFRHEQGRADRNKYVDIFWDNIYEEDKSNFEIKSNLESFGQPYDYASIMHYDSDTFSKNDKPTILPKDGDASKIRYRNYMSPIDLKKVNMLYGCPDYKDSWVRPCTDDRSGCARWASNGDCKSNADYMLEKCRKSCKECGAGSVKQTAAPVTKPPTKPTTKTTAPPSNCVDENTSCARWANDGECKINPNYMLNKCKKSCNVCGGTTNNDCKDFWATSRCADGKKNGKCSSSSTTKTMCKKTCGRCNRTNACTSDDSSRCARFFKADGCHKNPEFMYTRCKKTCNIRDCS